MGRKRDGGFTLVELMVTVTVIGIIAAIALPQLAVHRQRAFDGRAQSDLRNAATLEEAYFTQHAEYKTCSPCDGATLPGFRPSRGVTVSMIGAQQSLTGMSYHPAGRTTFTWNNSAGGLQ